MTSATAARVPSPRNKESNEGRADRAGEPLNVLDRDAEVRPQYGCLEFRRRTAQCGSLAGHKGRPQLTGGRIPHLPLGAVLIMYVKRPAVRGDLHHSLLEDQALLPGR